LATTKHIGLSALATTKQTRYPYSIEHLLSYVKG
jgi:hypothetical protein